MRAVGWVFVILGAIGIPLGFYLQSQANHQAEVNRYLDAMGGYARDTSTAAPIIVGVGGAVLLVVGVVLVAVDRSLTQARAQAEG